MIASDRGAAKDRTLQRDMAGETPKNPYRFSTAVSLKQTMTDAKFPLGLQRSMHVHSRRIVPALTGSQPGGVGTQGSVPLLT